MTGGLGKRGGIKALAEGAVKEALKAVERMKASVRACVNIPLSTIYSASESKVLQFAKNGHQLYVFFGLANAVTKRARRMA